MELSLTSSSYCVVCHCGSENDDDDDEFVVITCKTKLMREGLVTGKANEGVKDTGRRKCRWP